MEKNILSNEMVIESTTKYLNVFNANKLELSGFLFFATGVGEEAPVATGSVFLIVRSYKHTDLSLVEKGRYKSFEFKGEQMNSSGAIPFCEVIDVEAMSAAEIVVLNNSTGSLSVTMYATAREVIL